MLEEGFTIKREKIWANKLQEFGSKNGVKVIFFDYGHDQAEKNLNNYNLFFIQEEKQKTVLYFLKEFEKYLCGPIFIDDAHDDLVKKNNWRKRIAEKFEEDLDAFNYINSNRCRINKFNALFGFLQDTRGLPSYFKEDQGEKKEEYKRIINKIPEELGKKEEDDKQNSVYSNLEKEKRVQIIKFFSDILKEVLVFFKEKK